MYYLIRILSFFPLLISGSILAATIQGTVIGIADGDTITVLDINNKQTRVRMMSIDAPERGQNFGDQSCQSLSELVFNKQVTIKVIRKDEYGRKVGQVFVNNLDVNLEQVRLGMAWHYKMYMRDQTEIRLFPSVKLMPRLNFRPKQKSVVCGQIYSQPRPGCGGLLNDA